MTAPHDPISMLRGLFSKIYSAGRLRDARSLAIEGGRILDALSAQTANQEPEGWKRDLIRLLSEIRPNFGAIGSRDVEVAAKQKQIDEAIAILLEHPAPSKAAAQLIVPHEMGYPVPETPVGNAFTNGWNDCRATMLGECPDDPTNWPAQKPVSPSSPLTDEIALELSRKIMDVVNGSWLPGGACQVQTKIQCLLIAALTTKEAPAQPDEAWKLRQEIAELKACLDMVVDENAKEAPADEWKEAVIEQCMVTEAVSFSGEPRKVLRELIDWHIALDRSLSASEAPAAPVSDEREAFQQLWAAEGFVPTWQPIETAPKGREVLLHSPHYRLQNIGDWARYCQYNSPGYTHWIEIPASPSAPKETGK